MTEGSDSELEIWMREVVARRCDSRKAKPAPAIQLEQVVNNLEVRRKKRTK